ncbi:MAG: GC-type dockerin domain-anchored protein [Phycisphaerales bacterium JB060]
MHRVTSMFVAGIAITGPVAHAQPALIDLGLPPGAQDCEASSISSDGAIVGGSCMVGPGPSAYRWTASGGFDLIDPDQAFVWTTADAMSADGQAIAGLAIEDDGVTAYGYRWTPAGGLEMLPPPAGLARTWGDAISGDGSSVVGSAVGGGDGRAFLWTPDGGAESLGVLPGAIDSAARAISADGRIVVGVSGEQPFRWTRADGMVSLGLPATATGGTAVAASADGSVIAANAFIDGLQRAHLWTQADGFVALPLLSGATRTTIEAISADGSTAVGALGIPANRAMYWRADVGTVFLADYLADLGVDVSGWTLLTARAMSADGSTIAGVGTRDGDRRAFLITGLPVSGPCRADIDGDGELTIFDFLAFQNLFDAGDLSADFDGDGELTIFDFLAFQNAFDAGC